MVPHGISNVPSHIRWTHAEKDGQFVSLFIFMWVQKKFYCLDVTILPYVMQIVNWRTHLKFPEEAKLSPEAKDLISKLLCNVNQRLGSKGADEIKVLYGVSFSEIFDLIHELVANNRNYVSASFFFQAHPWFKGIDWEKIYHMEAAFIPEVNDELDTQNFEKFEEV